MDFDPATKTLHNQEEVEKYLLKYDVHLLLDVKVNWCPPGTNYTKAPKTSDIYLHPQVLALELSFPMTSFICNILHYYQAAPVAGGWRVVQSFQALCNLYLPDSCRVEDFFCPLYNEEDQVRCSLFWCKVRLREADHQSDGQ